MTYSVTIAEGASTMNKLRFFFLIASLCLATLNGLAESEPNDSCASPQVAIAYGDTSSGLISGSSQSPDLDVFVFQLDSPGELTVTLSNTGTAKDLKYSLLTTTCPTATYTLAKTTSTNFSVTSTAATATYFLVLEGAVTNQATPYTISASFTPLAMTDTVLSVTKTGPSDIMPEEEFAYSVSVTNAGTVDALSVQVVDSLPSGVTFRPSTGCTESAGIVTCSVTNLTVGDVETFTINVTGPGVSADGTTISNTASASAVNADPVTSNTVNTDIHKPNLSCANPADYRAVYSQNIAGEIDIIGNSVMCMNSGGVCGDPGTNTNNNINMMYINSDGDGTTFNNSSADLHLPDESEVLWAGLYWQGMLTTDGSGLPGAGTVASWQAASNTVKIAPPGGGYTSVSATVPNHNWIYVQDSSTSSRWYYQAHADITSIVQAGGNGYYTVANIVSRTGQPIGGSFGAWSIVLVYKNLNRSVRNLAVYNGYMGVMGGSLTAPMSGDPLKAFNHANSNGCSTVTSALGVTNQVQIPLTGFKTPQSNDVNASFAIFSGEGDIGISGDSMFLQDKLGGDHALTNTVNPLSNVQNATISKRGAYIDTLEPQATYAGGTPWRNSLGIDIDFYDASAILNNDQTSTVVTLNSSGDGYFPGVFAFSTELYNPHFCYDYTYEQYDRDFTENNDGSNMPRIVGTLLGDGPIDVRIYLKNQEASDVVASNLKLTIKNIDTDQAPYKDDTVYVAEAGEVTRKPIDDALISAGPSGFQGVPMGTMAGNESAWLYYSLDPSETNATSVNMPIDGELFYTLRLPDGAGGYINIDRNETLGNEMPLCVDSGFTYEPTYGRFNIEYGGLFSTAVGTVPLYDIPTQVVQRADAFKIASYDINKTVSNPHDRRYDVNSSIAIELIDIAGYHDTDAACQDPQSSISERIWVDLVNGVADFNASVINTNSLSDNAFPSREFIGKARRNAAFRITYNAVGDEGDLVKTSYITSGAHAGNVAINNFTELAQGLEDYNIDLPPQDQNKCVQPVVYGNKTYTTMPEACGNASDTNGISREQLHICMECVYGVKVGYSCSRDNFAIRPQSFNVKLNDQNQTNQIQQVRFANDRTGVSTLNLRDVNLSAGYQYDLDINATNHYGNEAVSGYTQPYSHSAPNYEVNLSLIWSPDPLRDISGCRPQGTVSKHFDFNMIHGGTDLNLSISQVGEYVLRMVDTNWTAVDWDPHSMQHQTGIHYLAGRDCVLGNADVPAVGSSITTTPDDMLNVAGCSIVSGTHDNVHTNEDLTNTAVDLKYRNYAVRFYPYKFSLISMQASYGVSEDINRTLPWIYMSDVNNSIMEMNEATHLRGSIDAVGYDGKLTFNFVDNCYGEPINLYLEKTLPALPALPVPLKYRLLDVNDTNDTTYFIGSPTIMTDMDGDLNGSDIIAGPQPTLNDGNFTQELNGSTIISLNVNFDRARNVPINPLLVAYQDFNVTCSSPDTNCRMQADLKARNYTHGIMPVDLNMTHYYGRLHAPRYRIAGNDGPVTLYYEVYCDQNPIATSINFPNPCVLAAFTDHNVTMPNRLLSVDDIRWYQNEDHNWTEGNTTVIVQRKNAFNEITETNQLFNPATPNVQTWRMQYDQSKGYPFKATMNMTTDNWLIYDRYDVNASLVDFELEFNSAGGWAGENSGNIAVDSNASVNTNRRIEW